MTSKNILIIGPSWIGDMVMAQSLFITLKQQNSANRLCIVAPEWCKQLTTRMPEISETIPMPLGHGQFRFDIRRRLGKALRKQHFEQAFVLPNSWKSALIPWFAKIPKRTGWLGEMRFGLLNDSRKLNKSQLPLMVQRFVALAYPKNIVLPDNLPKPKLVVDHNVVQATRDKFNLITEQPILAICPGAEFGPAKQWPAAHYAEVATYYQQKGWQVWLFGSAKDTAIAVEIQNATNKTCIDLTGKTTLAEAIDLMSCVTKVATNDSGLMHVAAALGKPLVVVYGSTDPNFTPPLSESVKILRLGLECSPCFKRECPLTHLNCLKQLPPTQVIEALATLSPREAVSA